MKKFLLTSMILFNLNSIAIPVLNSEVGKGISSFDLDAGLKSRCIDISKSDVISANAFETTYKMELIENKEDMFDKISFSANAKGSYGPFSATNKMSFVKEVRWNHNSNYILVSAKRFTKKDIINKDNIQLSAEAKNLSLDSRSAFIETCGNSFSTEIIYGGEIYGLIEIKSSTHQEKINISKSISGDGNYQGMGASASLNFSRKIRSLETKYNIKVNFSHIGGEQVIVPNSVESLLDLANKIEEITDSSPVAIEIRTRDYSTLPNFNFENIMIETKIRQEEINFLEEKLSKIKKLKGNGMYVLAHQNEYFRFNQKILELEMNHLDNQLLELKILIAKGYSFLSDFSIDSIDLNFHLNLPKKKRRNRISNLSCELQENQMCGVKTYKNKVSSACSIIDVNEGTGPVCGAIFKEQTSPYCGILKYKTGTGKVCGVKRYKQCHHKDCGSPGPFRGNSRCRTKRCGVESYKTCENKAFGEIFNSCRIKEHGVESYKTCKDKEFGYIFNSCEHLSHGPDKFKSCELTNISGTLTYCPN